MFYIEKKQRRWSDNRKDFAIMHIGPALIVFLAFFGLTAWSFFEATNNIHTKRSQALSQNIQQTKIDIKEKLRTYEDILRASVGLFSASDSVTRSEWKQFIDIFEIPSRYPGVQAIGYAEKVNLKDLQSHVDRLRSDGVAGYHLYPSGERSVYYSIRYIEPATIDNKKAIGFDLYSEVRRQKAMDLARDSGKVALSDMLTIVQDNPSRQNPGFIMVAPLYERNKNPENSNERRDQNKGFIYAPFRAKDFLDKLQISQDKHFGFQLYDGVISQKTKLYESVSFKKIKTPDDEQNSTQEMTVNNQKWIIVGKVDAVVVSQLERSRPTNVLWGGMLFSIFVAGFIYLLLLNRARILAQKDEREIQDAKDELLALASHQLRTPATGVKQYVGLLREGYAGALSKEQKKFIEKAYASNERQLSTINEMLVVAHADAGTIELTFKKFNISLLVKDVCDEQTINAKKNNHKFVIKIPKKSIYLNADKRYVRMAIENIISNAIKYTPKRGVITIELSKKKDEVQLSIADTGVGVSKKNHPLLFQKFSRIPNELTNKVSGSGIGLYLAKKIVEAHYGRILFESKQKEGSVCTIILPINKQH